VIRATRAAKKPAAQAGFFMRCGRPTAVVRAIYVKPLTDRSRAAWHRDCTAKHGPIHLGASDMTINSKARATTVPTIAGLPRRGPLAACANALRAYSDMRRLHALDDDQLRDLGLTRDDIAATTFRDFLDQPRRV
jgi:uncharacterized protein YjiS (DUF1127 family)